jgi:hypothetical protein
MEGSQKAEAAWQSFGLAYGPPVELALTRPARPPRPLPGGASRALLELLQKYLPFMSARGCHLRCVAGTELSNVLFL